MCLIQTKEPTTNITPEKHQTVTKGEKRGEKRYHTYRNPQNKEKAADLILHHRMSTE